MMFLKEMEYLKVSIEKDALKNGICFHQKYQLMSNKKIPHRDVVTFKVLLKKLLHRSWKNCRKQNAVILEITFTIDSSILYPTRLIPSCSTYL